jgi:hypothetical protein
MKEVNRKLGTKVEGFVNFLGMYTAMSAILGTVFRFLIKVAISIFLLKMFINLG